MKKSFLAVLCVTVIVIVSASVATYYYSGLLSPSQNPTSEPTTAPTSIPQETVSPTELPSFTEQPTSSPSASPTTVLPTPTPEPTSVTITDMRNKTITLQLPIKRIVMVPVPDPAIYYSVGGNCSEIVGMNPQSLTFAKESVLSVLAPELLNASTSFVVSGFEVNIEELVKLKPDVVIQWARSAAEIKSCEQIEAVGIPVIGVKGAQPGTQVELDAKIRIYGQLAGNEEKAEELIAYHHNVIDSIMAVVKNIPTENKPRVLFLYSGLQVGGNGTYEDWWIETSGGINVADSIQGRITVTMEQIIAWNPDTIYIGTSHSAQPADLIGNKISGQDWSQIDAIKTGQVYKVPIGAYRWDPPNAESPLMLKLVEKQYPSLFSYEMQKEIRDFFLKFYSYQITDVQLTKILGTSTT